MTQELQQATKLSGELLEKVVLNQDLVGLNSVEKVKYINSICESIGLNPLTKPIQLLKFQGKEVMYFTKDATEQLRKINQVSLFIKDTRLVDDIYIVLAEATTPDGRTDTSSAAICISGLKGDAKANAFMKCETKAKRRVTLSICGLGYMDESETETIAGAKKITIEQEVPNITQGTISAKDRDEYLSKISQAESLEVLRNIFEYTMRLENVKQDMEFREKLISAKDERKAKLAELNDDFKKQWDASTGEIKNDEV